MLLVIKMGGSILKEGASTDLVADLKDVAKDNKVILVHGGGVEVTEIASKLGKEQKFIISPEGFRSRYTDKETIEIYTMVMAGKINKQIVLALQGTWSVLESSGKLSNFGSSVLYDAAVRIAGRKFYPGTFQPLPGGGTIVSQLDYYEVNGKPFVTNPVYHEAATPYSRSQGILKNNDIVDTIFRRFFDGCPTYKILHEPK